MLHDIELELMMMLKNEYREDTPTVYYILEKVRKEKETTSIFNYQQITFFYLDIRQVLIEDLDVNSMKQYENEWIAHKTVFESIGIEETRHLDYL